MRVVVLAIGSRGDIQPYVALSVALQAAGHKVQLAGAAIFKDLVEVHGVEFFGLKIEPKQVMESEIAKFFINSDRNPLGFLILYKKFADSIMGEMHRDFLQICQRSDAIIYSPFAVIGHFIAQKLGIPRFASALQPLSRTSEFPNILLPGWLKLGGRFNYSSHLVAEQLLWQPIRHTINEFISRELKMAPISMAGPFEHLYEEQTPGLYAFSPLVSPPPKDWPDWIHVTGYWFLQPSAGWTAPAELLGFLESGPPPVYIGFGSMTNRKPTEGAEIALEALEQTGQRGILLRGWGGMKPEDLPKNVYMLDSIPHTWLFPRMAAVVHHGGAGTTGAGLRSGVPSIVVPHFADQPYWGERVYKLGVGPRPIPRWRLTANSLAKAIRRSVEDKDMRANAAKLGEAIRAEKGVENAIEIILSNLNQK